MRQSDPLELVMAGTLAQPGPVGRLIRIALGAACLYALAAIVQHASVTSEQPLSTLEHRIALLFGPLCILNYVVNIGFSRSWGHRPLTVSILGLATLGALAFILTGSFDSPILGVPFNVWLGYFYAHLGFSFVLSAALATPGCEMRAIPELLGLVRGKRSREHHCPAAFITRIDEWERSRALVKD